MGREIRKVPTGWEHPQQVCEHHSGLEGHKRYSKPDDYQYGKCFKPLLDEDYETAAGEWMRNAILWNEGKHPDRDPDYPYYWEWDGNPPDKEYYRPKWTEEERTHFQIYETVSEGTPVSPVFASKVEMIDWLVAHGHTKSAAEQFADSGWAMSMVIIDGKMGENIHGLDLTAGVRKGEL
jgi:hypothetical protein